MVRRQQRYAPAAVAAGAVALVVAFGPARPSSDVPTVGAEEVRRLASPGASSEPAAGNGATVTPVRLRIPALGVTAPVDAVGVEPGTGELAVPANVGRTGWYRQGPGLDAVAGSIVVAGHVDGAGQGPGAFFRLRELDPGDVVTVTGSDGRDRRWRVVARETYAKEKLPLDRYFARDGGLRLTLVTCGGPFDAERRQYRDNVVVTAVPA